MTLAQRFVLSPFSSCSVISFRFVVRFIIQRLMHDSLSNNHVLCIRECADEKCKLQVLVSKTNYS